MQTNKQKAKRHTKQFSIIPILHDMYVLKNKPLKSIFIGLIFLDEKEKCSFKIIRLIDEVNESALVTLWRSVKYYNLN